MKNKMPVTPFAMRLSGSAKETELRIRNIFQWKKKRPPVVFLVLLAALVLLCGGLVGFVTTPGSGTLEELYVDYFTKTPAERMTIAFDDKDAAGHPLLTATDGGFADALEYLRSMELRTARGENQYIGDFDSRGGAITLSGAGGRELKLELYPTAECLVVTLDESAKVYRWPANFDRETFLRYWPEENTEQWTEEAEKSDTDTLPEADLAMQGILENLWDNSAAPRRMDGETVYELSRNSEFFGLMRTVAAGLEPVGSAEEFSALPGSMVMDLTDGSGGQLTFWAGETWPEVLIHYETAAVSEIAISRNTVLRTFMEVSAEHKYMELCEIDGDGELEVLLWTSRNNKQDLVICYPSGEEVRRLSVNQALGADASDHTKQIANIPEAYNNLISAIVGGEAWLFRYEWDGSFSYICTLNEAMSGSIG